MIYIFFTALFVCKNFHVNWPNDSLHPASTSFRAMLHIVMDDNAFCSIEALSREISCHHAACAIREALIKSLSDFILEFLFNARNKSTRIASYLRRLMTKHWIKIHMKFDSAN